MKTGLQIVAAGMVLLAAQVQAVTTWNANTDFSLSSSNLVNGVWSYGYADGSGANAGLMDVSTPSYNANANLSAWSYSGSANPGGLPVVFKNQTGAAIYGVPNGQLALHPDVPGGVAEHAVILFTAPATGNYFVNLTYNYVGGGNGVFASVSQNMPLGGGPAAALVWSQLVDSATPSGTFVQAISLTAGDNLAFAVNANGGFGGDSTTINLVISSGPAADIAVSSTPNPSGYGTPVVFQATLTGGSGTPSGTVQFKNGAGNLGSPVTLSGGVANYTYANLTPGNYPITAAYSGDSTYIGGGGTLAGGQTVIATYYWDAAADFSITNATASSGAWSYGYASSTLDNAGLMTYSTSAFAAVANVDAWYLPTMYATPAVFKNNNPTVQINCLPGKLALHPDVNGASENGVIWFTAPTNGNYSVDLKVTYCAAGGDGVGVSLSKNLPLAAGGPASTLWSAALTGGAPVGTYANTVSLNTGDTLACAVNNGAGDSIGADTTMIDLTIRRVLPATVTVISSQNPANVPAALTFTATVAGAAGTPTGTVQFKDGASNLGSPVTMSGGVATCTATLFAPGSHVITAVYIGNTTYGAATGTLAGGQTVTGLQVWDASADFSLASNPKGVWSYQWLTSLSAFGNMPNSDANWFGPGLAAWGQGALASVPVVMKNNSASTFAGWAPGVLGMHPGSGGNHAVVTWTAPSAGTYSFASSFTHVGTGGNGVIPSVAKDLATSFVSMGSQWIGPGSPYGSVWAWNNVLALNAGETISWALNPNGDEGADSTVLSAIVTAVPLPTLSYTRAGSYLTLSWPLASTGYALEATSLVNSGTWTNMPGVVNQSVAVGTSEAAKFYRLRWQ